MPRLKATPVPGSAPDLRATLEAADLPIDDLDETGRLFFRFDIADSPVAYGGLELLGDAALVRSVVVLPHMRGMGFGRQATDTLLDRAAALGARQAYLLTTTAASFFERLGFARIERANAPTCVMATREATALCPSTAIILTRPITKDPLMTDRIYNVLFLCTGNSARSILAESILSKEGAGRFRAFSAGSFPKGAVHPMALKVLKAMDYPHEGFRSKSWDEFAADGAPRMDFIFTVCDNAAGEVCPIWPGHPMSAHWGIEDPAAVDGSEIDKERAFSDAARYMKNRIAAFINLPIESIDRMALGTRLRDIGQMQGSTFGRAQAS